MQVIIRALKVIAVAAIVIFLPWGLGKLIIRFIPLMDRYQVYDPIGQNYICWLIGLGMGVCGVIVFCMIFGFVQYVWFGENVFKKK